MILRQISGHTRFVWVQSVTILLSLLVLYYLLDLSLLSKASYYRGYHFPLFKHTIWITPPRAVHVTRFSNDGRFLYSCSDDNTVRCWDIPTQQEIASYADHKVCLSGFVGTDIRKSSFYCETQSCQNSFTYQIWCFSIVNILIWWYCWYISVNESHRCL